MPAPSESSLFNIIVVGGGIAGLSAPNASKIVETQWGLGEGLAKTGSMADKAFRIYNTEGKLHAEIPFHLKKSYGAVSTQSEGNVTPVEIRTGSVVRESDPETGTVKLDSGEVLSADLIIGADGIKSVLRQFIIGKEAPAIPTGLSGEKTTRFQKLQGKHRADNRLIPTAYRLVINSSELEQDKDFTSVIDPRESFTTMIMGHDRRIIMGPARNGSIYSIVALVPDDQMQENAEGKSWTTKGSPDKLRETFDVFPKWAKAVFKNCTEVGLWQLRDLDPLNTWYRERAIIIGDAAHPMLPTQGQGASQAIEDAEALGAIFADIEGKPTRSQITEKLKIVFDCRYERATVIQGYSRASGKPATDKGNNKITMNPAEFMDYNCTYNGAKDWIERQARAKILAKVEESKETAPISIATKQMAAVSLGSE
ncbi:hypothetical protein CFIO01_03244 [Colletotrichum fioriniae PJ7]|uniref:FAD-binding domain-containing protein n=1 Tax=Colletotrichum fioriniae PJ7 TaxID=1445577 RepID=A0A010SJX9_9PEZI|nr:hypothetical protein CFIO01_03244 [Colletotrichum fioriniae PJ7]